MLSGDEMGDSQGTKTEIEDCYLPASLEEGEYHLLASICENVTTNAARNRDEYAKYWDGILFQDFVDAMPVAHHEVFLRLLEKKGIGHDTSFKRMHTQGIGLKTAENVFCCSAKAQGIPLKYFLRKYVTYCQSEGIELKAFENHRKTVDKILNASQSPPENKTSIKEPPTIQPRLTIPKPKTGNDNYYANAALDVIGRQKEKELLEAFLLECDLNVAWFQLAGVAGQGKSRLAFDLVNFANSRGWSAGFLRENDIQFFKDKWTQWQPDRPHLLVFDYVIGREHEIKPIIQSLTFRQYEFSRKIRILILERPPWNRGTAYNIENRRSDTAGLPLGMGNRSPWFLNLCEAEDHNGETLSENRFAEGVIELKNLTEDELLGIVKQLTGENCSISDVEIKKMLKRIDDSGRPLYAYLLARQINDNPENFQSWTKIDLLNGQLEREKRRWEKAFPKMAPTWGDSHPAMKLAVLATISRLVSLDDDFIKQHFGKVDSDLGNQSLAIASGSRNTDDERPTEIYAIKPDLLGEWFVLMCFHKGLELNEMTNLAWRYKPSDTAEFLQRLSSDFPNDPVTVELLDHSPPDEASSNALTAIAAQAIANLFKAKCSFPPRLVVHLEKAATSGDQNSMNLLGYLFLLDAGLKKNITKAYEWWRKSADAGNGIAMAALGDCYFHGHGVAVERDFNQAIEWYRKGVDANSGGAMRGLGVCYYGGRGVEANYPQAAEWIYKGAKAGDKYAMTILGNLYFYGHGVEQSYENAVRWYLEGDAAGDAESMNNIGSCYINGTGVEQNFNEAIVWYKKSSVLGNERAKTILADLQGAIKFVRSEGYQNNSLDELWAKSQVGNLVSEDWELSPIISGGWNEPNQESLMLNLTYLRRAFRVLDSLEDLDDKIFRRMRILPLKFYPEHFLLEAEFYCANEQKSKFCSAVLNENSALLLNGNATLIHVLNIHLLDFGAEGADLDYIKFFCGFTQAGGAPFLVMSSLNELNLAGSQLVLPDGFKEEFIAISHAGGAFNQEGSQNYEVFVLHQKKMFFAILNISDNGVVQMPFDRLVTENLPVLQPQFDGFFYCWC